MQNHTHVTALFSIKELRAMLRKAEALAKATPTGGPVAHRDNTVILKMQITGTGGDGHLSASGYNGTLRRTGTNTEHNF
jgi:hypothetical protein